MQTTQTNNKPKSESHLVGSAMKYAATAAVGAAVGILFAPKKGSQTRRDVANRFHGTLESVKEEIERIFGEVSDELENTYLDLRDTIASEIESLKKEKEEITQRRYAEVVRHAVKEFSKGKKWSQKVIKNLENHFENAWETIKATIS